MTDQRELLMTERKFTILSLAFIALVALIGYIFISIELEPIKLGTGEDAISFSFSKLWIMLVIAYTVFSIRFWDTVKLNQNAAITLFGKPMVDVGAGAPFALLFLMSIERVTSEVIQKEFPGEPQDINRKEMKDNEKLPEGMVPPIRIQFRDSITQEEAEKLFLPEELAAKSPKGDSDILFVSKAPKDGLAKRVTAEPYPVVRFSIESPTLFLRNIGDVEKAVKQIEDEMFSVLTRFYPRISVGQALQNVRWINAHLFNAVKERTDPYGKHKSWGINLQAAYLKYIYTSHGVNTAISEAAQAPFVKEKTITTAQGDRRKLILEGEGKAQAAHDLEFKTLEGRSEGMLKIAKDLEMDGIDVQSAEVARAVADGGNTFVVGAEGMGQIAGLAAAAYTNTKKSKEKTPEGGE